MKSHEGEIDPGAFLSDPEPESNPFGTAPLNPVDHDIGFCIDPKKGLFCSTFPGEAQHVRVVLVDHDRAFFPDCPKQLSFFFDQGFEGSHSLQMSHADVGNEPHSGSSDLGKSLDFSWHVRTHLEDHNVMGGSKI